MTNTKTTSEAPVTIGDLLLDQPSEGLAHAVWLQKVLSILPEAWLVEHPHSPVREVPETGCRVVAFLAPTEQNVRELAETILSAPKVETSVLANGPAIYSLREVASLLIEKGYGAAVLPYSEDAARSEDGLVFTVGDLVKLVLEGVIGTSPTAHQWARVVDAGEEQGAVASDFLLDAKGNPEKLQLARPPEEVIPEVLWTALNRVLETDYPNLQQPALARNSRGELALVFFAKIGKTIDGMADKLAKLNWLFPSHYHILLMPRES